MQDEDRNEIVFEDPPPKQIGGRTPWAERLAPLKDKPNTWARVIVKSSQRAAAICAYQLSTGDLKPPRGEWEFVSRGAKVYARYLGEK